MAHARRTEHVLSFLKIFGQPTWLESGICLIFCICMIFWLKWSLKFALAQRFRKSGIGIDPRHEGGSRNNVGLQILLPKKINRCTCIQGWGRYLGENKPRSGNLKLCTEIKIKIKIKTPKWPRTLVTHGSPSRTYVTYYFWRKSHWKKACQNSRSME